MDDTILIRHIKGEADVCESRAVMAWIEESAENRERYIVLMREIALMASVKGAGIIGCDEVERRLLSVKSRRVCRGLFVKFLSCAAILLCILALGLGFNDIMN